MRSFSIIVLIFCILQFVDANGTVAEKGKITAKASVPARTRVFAKASVPARTRVLATASVPARTRVFATTPAAPEKPARDPEEVFAETLSALEQMHADIIVYLQRLNEKSPAVTKMVQQLRLLLLLAKATDTDAYASSLKQNLLQVLIKHVTELEDANAAACYCRAATVQRIDSAAPKVTEMNNMVNNKEVGSSKICEYQVFLKNFQITVDAAENSPAATASFSADIADAVQQVNEYLRHKNAYADLISSFTPISSNDQTSSATNKISADSMDEAIPQADLQKLSESENKIV